MNWIDAIAKLQGSVPAVKAQGATSLYLFGSTARDEAKADSDIDLFIDYDPASKFNAFDLVGIKLFLEDELHTPTATQSRGGVN